MNWVPFNYAYPKAGQPILITDTRTEAEEGWMVISLTELETWPAGQYGFFDGNQVEYADRQLLRLACWLAIPNCFC